MAADAANLLEKYQRAASNDAESDAATFRAIMNYQPAWETHEATKDHAKLLQFFSLSDNAFKTVAMLEAHVSIIGALFKCMSSSSDERQSQWILTLFQNMLRSDSSAFNVLALAMKEDGSLCESLKALLAKRPLDSYSADKAAWILSAMIGNTPHLFCDADVHEVIAIVHGAREFAGTRLGALDAVAQMLKADRFRGLVWSDKRTRDAITMVDPATASPEVIYKIIFCLWLVSFDDQLVADLAHISVAKKLRYAMSCARSEKVVRIGLTLIRNLMDVVTCCEDLVESGILEVVQQLEYEKWHDADLYPEIQDVAGRLARETQQLSNYERYDRELKLGVLSWGFVHTSKFWAENVMKFSGPDNQFRAIKMLAGLLVAPTTDTMTLAVACHDIGEFVALHPHGRKVVSQLGVKERVMELMASQDGDHQEVRRHALLCCQKIMLNRWQDVGAAAR